MLKKNLFIKSLLFTLGLGLTGAFIAELQAEGLKDKLNKMFDNLGGEQGAQEMKESTQTLLDVLDSISKLDIDEAVLEQDNQAYKLTEGMNDIVGKINALDNDIKQIILPVAQLKIAYARVIKQLGADKFKIDLIKKLKTGGNFEVSYFMNSVTELFNSLEESIKNLNVVKKHIKVVIKTCVEKLNSLVNGVKTGVIDKMTQIEDNDTKFLVLRGKVFTIDDKAVDLKGLIESIKNIFKDQFIQDLGEAVAAAIAAIKNLPEIRKNELKVQHEKLVEAINKPVGGALVDAITGAVEVQAPDMGDDFNF